MTTKIGYLLMAALVYGVAAAVVRRVTGIKLSFSGHLLHDMPGFAFGAAVMWILGHG